MKRRDDPSVIKNWEEARAREKEQWWIGWANNLDAQHIIAIGRKSMTLDEVNDVLEKKWFRKLHHFPREIQVDADDELYLDF